MNNIIYKYPLAKDYLQYVELPQNAEILAVDIQKSDLVLWALIDSNTASVEPRQIALYYTGEEIVPANQVYINTINTRSLVYHAFEVLNRDVHISE